MSINRIILLCISAPVILMASCIKKGKPIEEAKETILYFQAYTADTLRLGIRLNDQQVFNDFYTPTLASRALPVSYYGDNKRKVTIFNTGENRVLFDSIFELNTSSENITLYQQDRGLPLIYIAPPANETAPPEGFGKVSLSYSYSQLPEEVEVVIKDRKTAGGSYDSTDGFRLQKGIFSRYFLARLSQSQKPQVLFYATDPARKLLAVIDAGQFGLMNPGFTIYSARSSSSVQNGAYLLSLSKLY